jgi:hypothetical protein
MSHKSLKMIIWYWYAPVQISYVNFNRPQLAKWLPCIDMLKRFIFLLSQWNFPFISPGILIIWRSQHLTSETAYTLQFRKKYAVHIEQSMWNRIVLDTADTLWFKGIQLNGQILEKSCIGTRYIMHCFENMKWYTFVAYKMWESNIFFVIKAWFKWSFPPKRFKMIVLLINFVLFFH